jgi:hypothetical protein
MSVQRSLAVGPIIVFMGLGSSSCASVDPGVEHEAVLADQSQALDPFCVDHQCPDFHPRKYSELGNRLAECYRPFRYDPDPARRDILVVAIENLGPVNSTSSWAKFWVDYYKGVPVQSFAVPSITANARADLQIHLPSECTDAATSVGCTWHVEANAGDGNGKKARETNEGNNTTMGACIL